MRRRRDPPRRRRSRPRRPPGRLRSHCPGGSQDQRSIGWTAGGTRVDVYSSLPGPQRRIRDTVGVHVASWLDGKPELRARRRRRIRDRHERRVQWRGANGLRYAKAGDSRDDAGTPPPGGTVGRVSSDSSPAGDMPSGQIRRYDCSLPRRRHRPRVLTLDRLQGLRSGMAATPESGFLVIADLTGYTAYLSGSEIEHAPAIAGDLLETIVGRLEPPFRLAKFEGTRRSCSSRTGAPTGRSCSTRSRPPTSPSGAGSGASTRRRAATATRAGWRRGSTSRCSSTTAPSSRVGSPAATSWRDPMSSSSIGC